MELTSSAFRTGCAIPRRYTGDGDNVSPPLDWTAPPNGTKSFVLLCADPDARGGTWYHWAVYDIPANRRRFSEFLPRNDALLGLHQAQNDFRRTGYDGPRPPRGDGAHHYHFRLMALSVARLELDGHPSCAEVESAAGNHVLAEAELTGTYAR